MPNRFIGDHGLAMKVILEDAQKSHHEGIGIAIDSAKAYDYVNEQYICAVLDKFGFPISFITTIRNLFFKNNITINMNGFMSKTVLQRRGLRQGDAISPILCNYALEPLLLAILNDPNIQGYQLSARISKPALLTCSTQPIKLLAYADDLMVFVNNISELTNIQDHIVTYGEASNSRVNYHKSVAFPLSGNSSRISEPFHRRIGQLDFQWFDSNSQHYLRYLGFPIWFTNAQRDQFCNEAILKLQNSVDYHQSRAISVYGRAHMAYFPKSRNQQYIIINTWAVFRLWIYQLSKIFYNNGISLPCSTITLKDQSSLPFSCKPSLTIYSFPLTASTTKSLNCSQMYGNHRHLEDFM